MSFIVDILNLVYPVKCEVCGRLLAEGESVICSICYLQLPRTNYHRDDLNPMIQIFWGRAKVLRASSYFFFYKGSPFQSLLHKLKYKGNKNIGIRLGKLFAAELMNSPFSTPDLVIPVPLHPKKLKKRGYNQSEMIAIGVNELFQSELNTDTLIRIGFAKTQTNKGRFDRFLNMEDQFQVVDEEKIIGKSVLLIDDVITTGSTLEACAQLLLEAGCGELNILTLAIA